MYTFFYLRRACIVIVVGIDPSLTATGIAVLDTNNRDWHVSTVKSAPVSGGELGMHRRMSRIVASVTQELDAYARPTPDMISLFVIEAPAFSKNNGMAHERAGLWWQLYGSLALYSAYTPILVIKPNVRAKYATGRGNAGKDEVLLAASRRYAECAITNNNEADAVVLAAMGARHKTIPIEPELPLSHIAAMRTLL
jgi:crossover junction endodeoxyribonuclease RuvC